MTTGEKAGEIELDLTALGIERGLWEAVASEIRKIKQCGRAHVTPTGWLHCSFDVSKMTGQQARSMIVSMHDQKIPKKAKAIQAQHREKIAITAT